MPAYQSDYIDFYMSVMAEVNELTRIKVHKRIKKYMEEKWFSFKMFIKYKVIGRIKNLYTSLKWKFFPPKQVTFKFERLESPVCRCMSAPMDFHSSYGPQDEKISLSQYAYGRMIDQRFKKRFIDAKNYRSTESIYSLKKEAVDYIYKQKLDASLLLRIAVFLHFT